MERDKKVKIGRSFIFILILTMLLASLNIDVLAESEEKADKKAIIFILDEVSLEEIEKSNTPNIDRLMENGSMALMNTRAKSSLKNKGSRYLSLGMGVRSLASTEGGLSFGRNESRSIHDNNLAPEGIDASDVYKLYTGKEAPEGEIVNVAIADIKRTALDVTPNNQVGLFGNIARENGLKVGVIGNSDFNKPARETVMMAMDEDGIVPLGAVGSELLVSDPSVLGGIRLGEEKMLVELNRILGDTDILFIDYGDTIRVQKTERLTIDSIREEQKLGAIERADLFLGKVMERVDMDNTLFMLLSPNPSKKMINEGNFGLTPVLMSKKGMEKGLLSSKTTRREGLVTNFDFGPSIFSFFGVEDYSDYIGEAIESVAHDDPMKVLSENEADYLYLRSYRKVFHWGFIIMVLLTLFSLYLPVFSRWDFFPANVKDYLTMTVMGVPLTMLTVSLFGYKFIVLDLIYVFGGAFILGYILNKILKDKYRTIGLLAFLTSLLILIDSYIIQDLMIVSPLGSDAIAGGRFYGVGNDYMGILLASSLLAFFIFFERRACKKTTILFLLLPYLGLIIIALSPFFGANMGGTLSAMGVLLFTIVLVLDRKISFKKLIVMALGLVGGILLIARLDVLFNPNPSHAGKALSALGTGGISKFIEIISSKLRQVFWNLAYASWNIVLFLQLGLGLGLFKLKKEEVKDIEDKYPILSKGFKLILLAGLAIFFLNDTGTIAAALVLTYTFIPLGNLLKINIKKEH